MSEKEFLGLVATIGIVVVFFTAAVIGKNCFLTSRYIKAGYHQVFDRQNGMPPMAIWVKTEGCP